jgi:GAF domain-containing protein
LTLKKSTIPNLVLFQRWSGLPRPVFFADCALHCAIVQVCKQKVVALSLTLFCAAVKLNLLYRARQEINRVNQHLQSTNAVVASVRERLAATARLGPVQLLDGVVEALTQRYSSIEIYLAVEGVGVCKSRGGHVQSNATMADVNAEIAVPIMLGAKTLGLLVAETGRTLGSARHWARSTPRQERALLHQVAELIAQYVAASLRKTSNKLQTGPMPTAKRKAPQSARAAVRKAAAGDHFPR